MKLNLVLQLLEKRNIKVEDQRVDDRGNRTIVVAGALPAFPYGGRIEYATIILPAGSDDVTSEQRESIKRRLCHLTQDLFGDEPEAAAAEQSDDDEETGSHLHPIIRKQ